MAGPELQNAPHSPALSRRRFSDRPTPGGGSAPRAARGGWAQPLRCAYQSDVTRRLGNFALRHPPPLYCYLFTMRPAPRPGRFGVLCSSSVRRISESRLGAWADPARRVVERFGSAARRAGRGGDARRRAAALGESGRYDRQLRRGFVISAQGTGRGGLRVWEAVVKKTPTDTHFLSTRGREARLWARRRGGSCALCAHGFRTDKGPLDARPRRPT